MYDMSSHAWTICLRSIQQVGHYQTGVDEAGKFSLFPLQSFAVSPQVTQIQTNIAVESGDETVTFDVSTGTFRLNRLYPRARPTMLRCRERVTTGRTSEIECRVPTEVAEEAGWYDGIQ